MPVAGPAFLTWSGEDPIKLWGDNGGSVETLHTSLGTSVLGSVGGLAVFGRPEGGATLWNPNDDQVVHLRADGYSISTIVLLDNEILAAVCRPLGQRLDRSHIITWRPDGTVLANWQAGKHLVDILGYREGRILSWCPDSPVILWNVDGSKSTAFAHERRPGRSGGGDDYVMNLFILKNGNVLARSRDGILDVWTGEGNLRWSKDLHAEHIGNYDQDHVFVSAGWQDDIKILNLDGEKVGTLSLPPASAANSDSLFGCHMMEDGELVATFLHGALAAWSKSGALKWYVKAHESTVFQVMKLADGRLLSLSASGELRLWSRAGVPCGDPFRHVRESIKGVIRLDNGAIACWSTGTVSVFHEARTI